MTTRPPPQQDGKPSFRERHLKPQGDETIEQYETAAIAQGVYVRTSGENTGQRVTVNGPFQLDGPSRCSVCKCRTSNGNCWGFALCHCGNFRHPDDRQRSE